MMQLGEGAPDYSRRQSVSQIKDSQFYGRKVMHEFVALRTGRNHVRQQRISALSRAVVLSRAA